MTGVQSIEQVLKITFNLINDAIRIRNQYQEPNYLL
jgi:hypothetical protein